MPTDNTAHDQSRQAAAGRDSRYSLTIEQAADLYAKAGHPRTLRTIQRYCASGHLDSIKVATALGDKYLVDPTSLSRHVAQTVPAEVPNPTDDRARHGATDGEEPRQSTTEAAPVSSPGAPQSLDVSRYVAGLEREVERLLEDRQFDREQIRTKDKQIESLLERDRETNFLIRGLQEMIPRLAQRTKEPPDSQHAV